MTEQPRIRAMRASVPRALRAWVVPTAWSCALAALIVGPMSRRGWVVLLDWVTGPRSGFADRITSGASLPAGPLFFALAAALRSTVGAATGWLVPAIVLVVSGLSAARLARGLALSTPAVLTAVTAYEWNPFVHERLYAGQLAVLLGYALLPFVCALAIEHIDDRSTLRGALVVGAGWALAAAASIHFAVIGGVIVVAVAAAELALTRRRDHRSTPRRVGLWFASTFAVAGALTTAWVLPRLHDAPPTGDVRTIAAFATRGDPNLGLAGGVAAMRGFWRATPAESSAWWWMACVGVLGGAALIGLASLGQATSSTGGRRLHGDGAPRRRLAVVAIGIAAVVGWLLGQGGSGLAGPVYRWLTDVPGMRIMREAGKFIALVALAWTLGLAGAMERLGARPRSAVLRPHARRHALAVAFVSGVGALVPITLAPGLLWGVGGRLEAVRYPAGWETIAAALEASPAGDVVVLPFTGYDDPGFTGGRVVRSVARAYFGPRAIISDDTGILGLDSSARTVAIERALRSSDPATDLAKLGVGWLISRDDAALVSSPSFIAASRADGWTLSRNTKYPVPAARG